MVLEQFSSYQIGKMLNVSRQAVNQWIDKGYIQSYRTPGGHRRVRREDLMSFLSTRAIPVPAALLGGEGMNRSTTLKVVVVEGDGDHATRLVRAINERMPRAQVRGFSSAVDALLGIGEEAADILLVDWNLRDINGPELCRRLKENERTQATIVTILAAPDSEPGSEALRILNIRHVFHRNESLERVAEGLAALAAQV